MMPERGRGEELCLRSCSPRSIGSVIGASMVVLFSFPEQRDILERYRGQPKNDVVLVILLYLGLVMVGAFFSAWLGNFLAFIFKP
jgi:hypothetical protein